ncbi:helix-turn-helix domain-containing protein [Ensifer sp. Root142]|uniref:winged helix-turn-helix transcriptional regulator n=1 Tax=Ensifer sp. Root142 TaxID=1736461 RepID=UPI000AE2189A|nr:helix-turn-helix domain-containing protein [Ensifer sp. Root142]
MYAALNLISGKLKGMSLYHLLRGTLRFNALKRELGDCSQRLLIKQLRELEEDGLVERKVFAVIPPQGGPGEVTGGENRCQHLKC